VAKQLRFGKYISLAGKAIGTLLFLTPALTVVNDISVAKTVSVGNAGHDLMYRYTGYYDGFNGGNSGFQWNVFGQSAAAIGGGIIVIKLFSWLGKVVH
jgi:hypothetical protein